MTRPAIGAMLAGGGFKCMVCGQREGVKMSRKHLTPRGGSKWVCGYCEQGLIVLRKASA